MPFPYQIQTFPVVVNSTAGFFLEQPMAMNHAATLVQIEESLASWAEKIRNYSADNAECSLKLLEARLGSQADSIEKILSSDGANSGDWLDEICKNVGTFVVMQWLSERLLVAE